MTSFAWLRYDIVGMVNRALPLTVGNGDMTIARIIYYGNYNALDPKLLIASAFAKAFVLGISMNGGYIGGTKLPLIYYLPCIVPDIFLLRRFCFPYAHHWSYAGGSYQLFLPLCAVSSQYFLLHGSNSCSHGSNAVHPFSVGNIRIFPRWQHICYFSLSLCWNHLYCYLKLTVWIGLYETAPVFTAVITSYTLIVGKWPKLLYCTNVTVLFLHSAHDSLFC